MDEARVLTVWDYHGVWILIGIVIGTIINILVSTATHYVNRRSLRKNLVIEFQMNLKTIDFLVEEVVRYRNAINSGTLQEFYGYFAFGRIMHPAGNEAFIKGHLYKWLTDDLIIDLNDAYFFLSIEMAKAIYDKIDGLKKLPDYRVEATNHADGVESMFKRQKGTLKAVLEHLKK